MLEIIRCWTGLLDTKLLENSRGPKFSLDFQALQEQCHKVGKQPSGRALLWFILNKYSLDKDRGASLSQRHLLSLKLHGKDVKSLEDFRQKMQYIMGALEQSEMPQGSVLRSMLYENVKHHPLMALAIDKIRSARETSSKRAAKWLMQKIDETVELAQQDENTTFVEKALQTSGGKQVPANPGKPDKNAKASNEKPDKKSKEEKPQNKKDKEKPDNPKKDQKGQPTESSASVNAAPGPSKGAGKGKKFDSKSSFQRKKKLRSLACTLPSAHAQKGKSMGVVSKSVATFHSVTPPVRCNISLSRKCQDLCRSC